MEMEVKGEPIRAPIHEMDVFYWWLKINLGRKIGAKKSNLLWHDIFRTLIYWSMLPTSTTYF
jgi:hypothetical protein